MSIQLICASHSPLMLTDVEESEAGVHAQRRSWSSPFMVPPYSYRNAWIGSTLVAQRAGM